MLGYGTASWHLTTTLIRLLGELCCWAGRGIGFGCWTWWMLRSSWALDVIRAVPLPPPPPPPHPPPAATAAPAAVTDQRLHVQADQLACDAALLGPWCPPHGECATQRVHRPRGIDRACIAVRHRSGSAAKTNGQGRAVWTSARPARAGAPEWRRGCTPESDWRPHSPCGRARPHRCGWTKRSGRDRRVA